MFLKLVKLIKYLFLPTSLLFIAYNASSQDKMVAHFIDVGQADATLLEFPCGAILIDAGAQDEDAVEKLINYIESVFAKRDDLNNTLDAIFITHNHIDHTRALREIVSDPDINVKRYFDNGQLNGRGTEDPRAIRQIDDLQVTEILLDDIGKFGLTNGSIDPVKGCSRGAIDPKITLLFGRIDQQPFNWSDKEFGNKNNHSIVVRVDFGKSSFLFTGDLEEHGIELLMDKYEANGLLDIDVYQVGHHGSHNATTPELLEEMTPEIAIISCGKSTFGRNSNFPFTTFNYGHPREIVIDFLMLEIDKKRSKPKIVQVGNGSKSFVSKRISDKIYSTSWDNTIRVFTSSEGTFRVFTDR